SPRKRGPISDALGKYRSGIEGAVRRWVPAFAGMTKWVQARLDALRQRDWRALLTRRNALIGSGIAALAGFVALEFATMPPPLPGYAQAKAGWAPAEAWLYDRHGRLIDSSRIDFQARRLAWTPLADVAPAARDTLVAAEDRRFREHGGVDWWALGGAL